MTVTIMSNVDGSIVTVPWDASEAMEFARAVLITGGGGDCMLSKYNVKFVKFRHISPRVYFCQPCSSKSV